MPNRGKKCNVLSIDWTHYAVEQSTNVTGWGGENMAKREMKPW